MDRFSKMGLNLKIYQKQSQDTLEPAWILLRHHSPVDHPSGTFYTHLQEPRVDRLKPQKAVTKAAQPWCHWQGSVTETGRDWRSKLFQNTGFPLLVRVKSREAGNTDIHGEKATSRGAGFLRPRGCLSCCRLTAPAAWCPGRAWSFCLSEPTLYQATSS